MDTIYYKLPLNLDNIFDEDGGKLHTCSEIESIDQHIELIITTCPGEHKFNKNFGCRIWDMDFERVVLRKKWEEEFTGHIADAIQRFESRIKDIEVAIQVMEVTREDSITKTTAIKKKVIVQVKGILVSSGGYCEFRYKLFLGPLSTE
ncbi:GPW/gp25 family protein [Prevotella sp. 10(H)]|uniref:GPW/gp25 family protein n=1 Tax=Prevotella sp. 10(H) TaxID=1158294 RepID=UPI0004A75D02|nr:GPW/gp25 family protein [Prevotella sp. 10(H)]